MADEQLVEVQLDLVVEWLDLALMARDAATRADRWLQVGVFLGRAWDYCHRAKSKEAYQALKDVRFFCDLALAEQLGGARG